MWTTSGTPKPDMEEGAAPPDLCPGQQVPTGSGFGSGGGEVVGAALALQNQLLLPNLLVSMVSF